ncbi:MAG: hypothetical protein JSV44_11140 [Candidatus Zixiibacteriota bacterium]|nr:MAG: hypothetical protein JSV44_11140 [candidate division Zixibacteria bacterium]
MFKKLSSIGLILIVALLTALTAAADPFFENLQDGQKINGFTALSLYVNGADKPMGARLISDKYSFIVDLMRIQSVPQGFFWFKTLPTSDMGEPHIIEHLVLGKGNRGRYVSALEDMSLGNSSASTGQEQTVYHFNSIAGGETFYNILEAKLLAFLQPDYADEEIRREVCHIGISEDPQTAELFLEEKGTVYTEMVSAFEKPLYYAYFTGMKMLYGEGHPLVYNAGGIPSALRQVKPEDIRKFHQATHHLANMGMIIAIPDEIPADDFLKRLGQILQRCQEQPTSSDYIGIGAHPLSSLNPAPHGILKLVSYPSENAQDPGNMYVCWPAHLELDAKQTTLINLFISAFSHGQTSNLYRLFINSETRKIDLGGSGVWGEVSRYQGHPIELALSGVDNSYITEEMVDSVRSMMITEIKRVYEFADDSEELQQFNEEVESRLVDRRKELEDYLNAPPLFGYRRGPARGWLKNLEELEKEDGFRKSLILKNRFAYAESLLATGTNIWRKVIDDCRILTVKPYAIGDKPDPEIVVKLNDAKKVRLAGYLDDIKKKYGVDDDQEAITKYKVEFDRKTAELEQIAADQEMPGFIGNPPMTLDDQLKYEIITLPGDIPLMASTFENMNSSTVGIALGLDVVPEEDLVYLPFLPSVLTSIGVIDDGAPIPYDEMQARLRKEVLRFNANFDFGFQSGRIELLLKGAGSNLEELKNALNWMTLSVYSPYLGADNLPRMRDVVDQTLIKLRNRMKGSEEDWVSNPAYAYRYQDNPLFLSTNSFLTRVHHFHRLRCMLTDPGTELEQKELALFMRSLNEYGRDKNRDELVALLTALADTAGVDSAAVITFEPLPGALREISRTNAVQAVKAIRACLPEIPDANLHDDWEYLCRETTADMLIDPEVAIAGIKRVLALVSKADNARLFMISNSSDRDAALGSIKNFVGQLDFEHASVRQTYTATPLIVDRLKSRVPGLSSRPTYVGLVHEGTNNGVVIGSAKYADVYDTTAVLDLLSGKLYCGGGPHSLHMRTWGAGLAYSNGFGIGATSGRLSYYAERCPDVAETMRFVVNELKNAGEDPTLTDYAIAQVFLSTRASSRYEWRGQSMAADLADGYTPERIATYRRKVLEQRDRENLSGELYERMEDVYGKALIGYGKPVSSTPGAYFFLIGPEPQFESLENYIGSTEGEQPVYRLYPRDFWLTI